MCALTGTRSGAGTRSIARACATRSWGSICWLESRAMTEQRGGLSLDLKCRLPVPRARVFKALTRPEELAKWWGPHGYTSPSADFDPRVGGGYRITMQPPDGEVF